MEIENMIITSSNTNFSVDVPPYSSDVAPIGTPGPRENATRAYLVRHGIEYRSRSMRWARVPRIADPIRREGRAADMLVRAHRATYPAAYEPALEVDPIDVLRLLSARASLSPLGAPARALPGYGADRPTMSVQGRRYDVDDRVSRDLEAEADAILRAAGDDVHRVDVIDRWTFRPEVSPDRVAFKGAVRYRPHACHTSDGKITRVGDRKQTRNADGTITFGRSVRVLTHSRGENADGSKRRPWHQQVSRCTPRVFVAGTEGTSITWLPRTSITRPDGTIVRFRGASEHAAWHAPIAWRERFIGSRGVAMVRHASSTRPAHRPLGSVWSIDARNIRNRWKKATDEQIARAIAYRSTLVVDGSLVLANGATLVIDSDPSVAVPTTDRTRVRVMFGETLAPGESFALVDVVRRAALVD